MNWRSLNRLKLKQMKIDNIIDLERLRFVLTQTFGEVPENLFIESPELVSEVNELTRDIKHKRLNLRVHGVRVVEQLTEVETV